MRLIGLDNDVDPCEREGDTKEWEAKHEFVV